MHTHTPASHPPSSILHPRAGAMGAPDTQHLIDLALRQERRAEELVAAMSDEELKIHAAKVRERYRLDPRILRRLDPPPRRCRLMKLEIAATIDGSNNR